MKGDIILVEDHHRNAAGLIVDRILERVTSAGHPYCITVAGESGSGKSETGTALAEEFERRGTVVVLIHQDDYFVLPPKSNDKKRREDISWVGEGEVRLDLLDEHLRAVKNGETILTVPIIDYDRDAVEEEKRDVTSTEVVIAEGTYTSLLASADYRVFINRNRLDTLASRERRGREKIEPFIEKVLEIEHAIIAPHRERADAIIEKDYTVTFP